MAKSKAELILHPIRMRMMLALTGKELTAFQLAQALKDVPQATLYRHLNQLVNGGMVVVVEERPIRGTVEKVYTAAAQGANLSQADIASLSKEDHLHYFTAFITALLGQFDRYLQESPQVDFEADGIGYRQIAINLSDEELIQMAIAINQAIVPYLKNPAGGNRRRRLLSTVLMPATDEPARKNESESQK